MLQLSRALSLIPPSIAPYTSPIIRCIFTIYYLFVYLVFEVYFYFQPRIVVPPANDQLLLTSATKLIKKLKNGELKPSQIVSAYIKRIKEVNPTINALANDNFKEAEELAQAADSHLSKLDDAQIGELFEKKPLFGLPFTMKDSIQVEGKIMTVGVWSRKNTKCEITATVAQRMLDAGAIFLAYTNVPQLCMWVESENAIFGRSRNPYDSRRGVGGSSGGEGALQGAAASLMGLGSDIGGSVRIPSFMNGIFGMICAPDVIPLYGHIPETHEGEYTHKMGRIGPMTRFAEDLLLLTKVIGGETVKDIIEAHPAPALDDARLFFCEGINEYPVMEPISQELLLTMHKAISHFETKFDKSTSKIGLPEASDIVEVFFSSLKEDMPPLKNIMNCPSGKMDPIDPLKELKKYIFGKDCHHSLAVLVEALGDAECSSPQKMQQVVAMRETLRRRVTDLLGNDGILFFPSFSTVAPYHNELIAKPFVICHTGLANVLGLPAVQVPMGLNNKGLPLGVMVIASPDSEALLISVANELSQKFGGWVPPGSV